MRPTILSVALPRLYFWWWVLLEGFQAESNSDTIFRQADRDLRQALVRAERAIEQGDFADAVDEIGKLLAESTTDA